MEYLLDRIKELVSPLLDGMNIDLVELKMHRQNRQMFLRFFVDRPEGGITVKECANLNIEISRVLDEADLIQESFVLEVSSPGIDRPLVTAKDFRRVKNRKIKIYVSVPIENKLELEGSLVKVEGDKIIILVGEKQVNIPLDKINKARQVIN